jgi:hypothetical protein
MKCRGRSFNPTNIFVAFPRHEKIIPVALGLNPGRQRLCAKHEDPQGRRTDQNYFLLMKQGYEYAQKKLGVEVVFGSTPTEEADVEQLNILQSWLAEGSLEGLVVTPFRLDLPQQFLNHGQPEEPSDQQSGTACRNVPAIACLFGRRSLKDDLERPEISGVGWLDRYTRLSQ